MNLCSNISSRDKRRRTAAFTMIEIAIALGVIAFALIAIIGILPTGLQTQKDNREETLVNQDARLLIEAIKTGGRDLASDLGAFVLSVDGTNFPNGIPTTNLIHFLSDTNPVTGGGHEIVMNSISGALETRYNKDQLGLAFRYNLLVRATPNFFEFYDSVLSNQFYEVRLRFAWPVLPGPNNTFRYDDAHINTYVARALITGVRTNNLFYAQHYYQPVPLIQTNVP